MNKEELQKIIEKHGKWLKNEEDGESADLHGAYLQRADLRDADLQRADLRDADLQRADLRGANLRGANLQRADLRGADLREANLQRADLRGANLQRADLRGANLQRADLQGANLDFSCFPMWCGGSSFKADSRLVRQLLAHIVTLGIEDADDGLKSAIEAIKPEAKKSHRARDLGLLEEDNAK